jgi:hypothetical protein
MQTALDVWVQRGQPHPDDMGRFLRAVLLHDLMGAVFHGDEINRAALVDWAAHIHNEVPALCHGSVEALLAWYAHRGESGCVRCGSVLGHHELCALHPLVQQGEVP